MAEKEAEVTRLKQEIAALQAAKQQAALLQSIALREAKAQEAAALASASMLSNGDTPREPSGDHIPSLAPVSLPPGSVGSGVLHFAQVRTTTAFCLLLEIFRVLIL